MMAMPTNLEDKEKSVFVETSTDVIAKRVTDPVTQSKLDDVIAALGSVPSNDTTPQITLVNITTAGVEESFSLPANCKGFLIKSRQICSMRFSYDLGGTAANYLSISRGGFFRDKNFYTAQTIYFLVDRNNTDIEIVTYT